MEDKIVICFTPFNKGKRDMNPLRKPILIDIKGIVSLYKDNSTYILHLTNCAKKLYLNCEYWDLSIYKIS